MFLGASADRGSSVIEMTWMPAPTWTPPAATSHRVQPGSLAAWNGASPSWRTKPNRAAHRGCPASSPGPARNLRPPAVPEAPAPWLFPSTDGPHPPGGARGGELPRLRDPVVRRLDPSHPGGHRPAPGPRASHRARLHRPGLSPLPAQRLPPAELDGAALGKQRRQPGQPDRHPAGGGEAAHPPNGICAPSTSCASAWAPSSQPSIAWRNRPARRASWSASAAAPWSTPMRPAATRRLCVDVQHAHRPLLPGGVARSGGG